MSDEYVIQDTYLNGYVAGMKFVDKGEIFIVRTLLSDAQMFSRANARKFLTTMIDVYKLTPERFKVYPHFYAGTSATKFLEYCDGRR